MDKSDCPKLFKLAQYLGVTTVY